MNRKVMRLKFTSFFFFFDSIIYNSKWRCIQKIKMFRRAGAHWKNNAACLNNFWPKSYMVKHKVGWVQFRVTYYFCFLNWIFTSSKISQDMEDIKGNTIILKEKCFRFFYLGRISKNNCVNCRRNNFEEKKRFIHCLFSSDEIRFQFWYVLNTPFILKKKMMFHSMFPSVLNEPSILISFEHTSHFEEKKCFIYCLFLTWKIPHHSP